MKKTSNTQPPKCRDEPRRQNIAVVGDASCAAGSDTEKLAEELGRRLVDAGYRVVTGGLGGVMEAACKGAKRSALYIEGDTIGILPGFDPAAANPHVDVVIPTGLDYLRNSIVASSDAVVAVGGGAGTLSEICFAWMYKRLIIGLGKAGWAGRLAGQRIDDRVRYRDLPNDQVYPATSPDQVIELLGRLLPLYHKRHRGKSEV